MSRRRDPRLKKAHEEVEFDHSMARELMRCSTDPKYFIKNYIKVKHPTKGKIPFALYDYQEDMVDLYNGDSDVIIMSARQTGKTESICAYLLWYAIFHEDVTILIVSNNSNNAMEIIGKIQYAYKELENWIKPGIDDDSWNKHECKFDNSSRIVSTTTTEDSGRGMAISLLYCDELAFVKPNIQSKFWTSIEPTLSCLRGDTLVFTQDGLKTIESLHENREVGEYFELSGIDTWGLNGRERVSHGYVSPGSDTQIVKNRWGMEVEATLNHPFFVAEPDGPRMKPNKELTMDDYIRVDSGMNMWGDKTIDSDLAYMLGGYIAEGWTHKRGDYIYRISVSNTDKEFRDVYLNSTFVKPFRERKGENHKLLCDSVELVQEFKNFGVDLWAKCHEKTTPTAILEADKNTVCNYLAGLFDGDGSVTDRSINLTSTSKKLIQETQILLLNLGLVSNIFMNDGTKRKPRIIAGNKNETTKYKNSWSLNIPLSQYRKFKDIIPIKIRRKQDRLAEVSNYRKQDDFKHFSIPANIVAPTVRKILKESGESGYYLREVHNLRIDKILDKNPNRMITNHWFKKFSKIIFETHPTVWKKYRKFFTAYSEKCSWVRVAQLDKSHQEKTYDFTVPGSHAFLQSGFMGSNTGGRCIISSTPNGNSNLFAELWRGANNNINAFSYMHVPWDAPPGRDEQFKKEKIGKIGKRKWLQEFECCHPTSLIELSNNEETKFVKVPILLAYNCLENDIDIFNLTPDVDKLTGKYAVSPIDGKRYCRQNGRFLIHLREYGYSSYQDFFEGIYPENIKYCECGETASFNNTNMEYLRTCGNRTCVGRETSRVKNRFSPEQWEAIAEKYRGSMACKAPEEITDMINRRVSNGKANGSYKNSVKQRQETCREKYGDPLYNNAKQISDTKQNWDESRKEIFLDRLKTSLGGKSLNDFQSEETYEKRRKKLEDRGRVTPLEELTEWEIYRNRVRNLTNKIYRKHKDIINPDNLPRGMGKGKYELDHKIPVFWGYKNNIPEKLMADVNNLQMLDSRENRIKSFKYE